jgi:hypothetical protein
MPLNIVMDLNNVMGVIKVSNQPCENLWACLLLGEIKCQAIYLHPLQVFTFERGSSQGPLTLVMLVMGLHIDLDQLENKFSRSKWYMAVF